MSGKRRERISIIAALLGKKILAPLVFNGHTDTKIFNQWIEECLIPELPPGCVVIMDNASFHRSKKTRELIESANCRLVYLPPYSPDLNPIEGWWDIIKDNIRSIQHKFTKFDEAIDYAFYNLNYHKSYN